MNLFWRLLLLILPVWAPMLGALVLSALGALSSAALMGVAAYLIASAALHPMIYELSLAIVGVRFFGISRAIFRYAERYVSHDATFRILTRLRVWCYEKMEPLAPAGLQGYASGELFAMMIRQIDTLKDFYLRVLSPPCTALVVLCLTAAFLSFYSLPAAAVLAAAFFCVGVLLPFALYRWNRADAAAAARESVALKHSCVDVVNGIAELAAYEIAPSELARMRSNTPTRPGLYRADALADALGGAIANCALLGALILLIPLVETGRMTGVELAVCALVMQSSFESVLPLPAAWRSYSDAMRAAGQVFRIGTIGESSGKRAPLSAPPPSPFPLEVDGLRFSYGDRAQVISGASFSLRTGEKIALVGASGAGKSTLVNLLLNLRDFTEGDIRMNGVSYRALAAGDIRRAFNVVSQQTRLFYASIRENFTLLRPGAADEDIWRALESAELAAFVRSLPEGLDTVVGQDGRMFSGGQRQRLILARALVRPAPILLLDEPAAGLDAIARAKVMHTIERTLGDSAMILVTHQFEGLERMDRILALHGGKIAESGTFDELIAKKGRFYRMWMLQRAF